MRIRNRNSITEVEYFGFTKDNHARYVSLFENQFNSDITFSDKQKAEILGMLTSNGYVDLTKYGVNFK